MTCFILQHVKGGEVCIPGAKGQKGRDGATGLDGRPGQPGPKGTDGYPGGRGLPGKEGVPDGKLRLILVQKLKKKTRPVWTVDQASRALKELTVTREVVDCQVG